jgi:anti-sigma B factor antagonist
MGLTGRARARLEVVEPSADELVVELSGELDLAGLAAVDGAVAALLTRPAQPVVLDLGRLTFLDSSGVTLLVRLTNHFGQVRTRATTQQVRRVLEILGLAGRLGLESA